MRSATGLRSGWSDTGLVTAPRLTFTSSTAPAVRVLVGALRPKVISSQATSCWHRKLRWRPTNVARWPWRTDFSCFVDFIAPDGRTPPGRRRAQSKDREHLPGVLIRRRGKRPSLMLLKLLYKLDAQQRSGN